MKGYAPLRVVYLTPEFVDKSGDMIENLFSPQNLCLIAIDEAHCVSQWGHDFRAAYRYLHRLRDTFPSIPILALTATATDQVIKDMEKSLKLRRCQVVKTSFDRPNLVSIHSTNICLDTFANLNRTYLNAST